MLRTQDLDFDLPTELVATTPAQPRGTSRLLVCSRATGQILDHTTFTSLGNWLSPKDTLICNTTAVLPARLIGKRRDSGGRVEGLYLGLVDTNNQAQTWRVLLRSNGTLRAGLDITLEHQSHANALRDQIALELLERDGQAWLARPINAESEPDTRPPAEILTAHGSTPLPPYILAARKQQGLSPSDAEDRAWYQTVYAELQNAGSVAAPTAGLHFTIDQLAELQRAGIGRADVTLHVGEGTFRPVSADSLDQHDMHSEWIDVPAETLATLDRTLADGGRRICVGTTSCRAIESVPSAHPAGTPYIDDTELLISPGYAWKRTDALITNFHLPRSTLLAMVGALFHEPGTPPVQAVGRLLDIYAQAIKERYRFYSYGDAMLILP